MSQIGSPAVRKGLRRIIVLDTETTGLQSYDRIVTLAALRFEGETPGGDLHRVYDPRKDSHPGALAVHGWDDWTLRFQDLFADDAEEVRAFLAWADLLVMHNAAFDMRYVEREFRKAEVAPLEVGTFCTMEMARTVWSGSAKLDLCLDRIGLRRVGSRHGAYEDAALTAALYFHLQGSSFRPPFPARWPEPSNLRAATPRPGGDLPRRTTKKPGRRGAPALGSGPSALAAIAIERSKDGFAILRYIAEVSGVNVEAQADILDGFAEFITRDLGAPDAIHLRPAMIESALRMAGDESAAMDACGRIAGDHDAVQVVGPLIMALVKVDGAATEAEAIAVRKAIAAIRAGRDGR